jgi:hypothetical protein
MTIVTKQVSVALSADEQSSLFDLCDKISDTYVCELIHCANCASEICDPTTCPFHKLDDELREVTDKIFRAAKEFGPKGAN